MNGEEEFIGGLVDGAYDIINSLNGLEVFGIGAFTWIIIFFVAGFATELIRHMIDGGKQNNGS